MYGGERWHLAGANGSGKSTLLKTIADLSGGERLKVALLAVTAGTPPDLLLLDEPDNHLDLDSRELLETTLVDYPGALMVVSHDTDFIAALGPTHRLELG